ncbi:hypothetical protein QBC34DRAFT_123556 [Podospora aff. communis PSN243]|uniref:1-phosphatidylinositol-4-phosphate 5-kinase n=1 Tax=Podospora aff. communis PSN243 TaxID=3040156 RepID=A0AAV9GHE2_9PEZI|nr:hypothetical protein QBC34DRAFT_123556 [Podospora aff. communis PSN243]
MHRAPDMPSFLPDETSAIYSQSSGVVHLDPDGHYGLSQEKDGKANGHIPRQPQPVTSNESLDEISTHSTHTSEASDTRPPPPNGAPPPPPTMNSLPNGSPVEVKATGNGSVSRKPLVNGLSTTLVDRTVGSSGGAREDDSPAVSTKETFPRSSVGSIQQSPVEMYLHPVNRGDVRTVENGATTPSPLRSPAVTNLSGESSQKNLQPPHRYSSPPLYTGGQLTPSSSGALQPPGAGLKHRHTLEVPKPSPAPRGSRDGVDAAFSSGRFSPTNAATGVRRASLSLARRNTRSLHSDAPRDEIIPDDDALRWAEAYRQKRASKRRRREIEDDDRVLVGTKVDETHANWVTAYNMLTGIRVSVSRTNAKLDRDVTLADFDVKQKSTFDIAGNELVPSAKYDFKFKDYAPWVFRNLRSLFRLDPADYLMSLTGKYILSELGSPGKSGSFFYFSRDYKYIIKTIHHAEHKFLRKILKDYYNHVKANPNTLLSQFYGLHRVKMPYGKKIHFVVMNNLFPPHRDIHQTFDLKGSTAGRDYMEDDLEKNPRATLKDLNWLRRKRKLELGIQKKQLFLEQLQKDVKLLQRLGIMDYSLLIGIHDVRRGNEENLRDKTLRVFNPGGDIPEEADPNQVLMRTPSKLENQRKARELRQMIQAERPVPMGETSSRMPDELEDGPRPDALFHQDDGGFQATHEDNSPADEIYYLGVIDCLTHYGIIKKLENFWKGLSGDRSQISALPPQEYGDRFLNFISGITMSQEEAVREAQERDATMAATAAAEEEHQRALQRGGSTDRHSPSAIPPIPNYQPPAPPSALSPGHTSPEAEATVLRAEKEAQRSDPHVSESDVPDRTLRTTTTSGKHTHGSVTTPGAGSTVLPIVEEAAEGSTMGERSRNSRISSTMTAESDRPLTPAKDGQEMEAGFSNPILGAHHPPRRAPPPTPPKTGHGYTSALKPESADSGYGVTGVGASNSGLKSATGSQRSLRLHPQLSRDSLDKALPPLPRPSDHPSQSVS